MLLESFQLVIVVLLYWEYNYCIYSPYLDLKDIKSLHYLVNIRKFMIVIKCINIILKINN